MPSPSRAAIERYEARILAYERRRESRSDPGRGVRARPRPAPLRFQARRIVVLTALLLVLDAAASFWAAMTEPSNVSFGVRAVEWLRDNGAAGPVSDFESIYYPERPGDRRATAQATPPSRGSPAGSGGQRRARTDCPGDHAGATGRGTVARNRAARRRGCACPGRDFPPGRELSATRRRRRVDRPHTRALGALPGRYEPPNDGPQLAEVPPQQRWRLAGHVQQRLQTRATREGASLPRVRCTRPLRDGRRRLSAAATGPSMSRTWTGGRSSRRGDRVRAARTCH